MISERGELREEALSFYSIMLHDDPRVKDFHHAAWQIQRGKSFFTTAGGRMGTAEGMIQESDVVALISGMEMPIILRPDGDCYQVAAHAYVHGIMDGEAWP